MTAFVPDVKDQTIEQAIEDAPVRFEICNQGNILKIIWPDNYCSRFHAIWLRDNGQDSNTRDPSNRQKLITLSDIPEQTLVESASANRNLLELTFQPDQWTTQIDATWLRDHAYDLEQTNESSLLAEDVISWGAEFAENLPRTSFSEASSKPRKLLKWLGDIDRYGFALMDGLPDKSAAVIDVIGLFGFVRETNYGRYFEIKAVANPENLAYTSLGLQTHTDNPYRDPVPTLQFFGCLQNDAQGGESVVVDGFRAAEILQKESPAYFDLLASHNAQFDFRADNDVHLRATRPMIECSPEGQLIAVRFNNRSCDALTRIPFEKMQNYYTAYRRFAELLDSKELQVSFKLAPGQLFVVDNTRVLHGRKAYSSSGMRWMQGAYADKDSLKSKIRVLQKRGLQKEVDNNG